VAGTNSPANRHIIALVDIENTGYGGRKLKQYNRMNEPITKPSLLLPTPKQVDEQADFFDLTESQKQVFVLAYHWIKKIVEKFDD